MKVEVEDLSSVEKRVTVEIPAERVKDELDLAFQELQKTAQIKGFRPGKAPMKLLEREFQDYVRYKVTRKLLEETMGLALDRKQLKPILEPEIDFGELKPDSAFCYTMQVELRPQVELRQYKGLELEQEVFELTEEAVEKTLAELREQQAFFKELQEKRPAQDGDLLSLELKAECEGKEIALERGPIVPYIMGEEVYIPGFAQELKGIELGEKRTFKVQFPKDHPQAQLAGKEVEYTVVLRGIKEKILPELNDEFAQELGGYKDLAELRAKVQEQLSLQYQRMSRIQLERNLLDRLVELNPLELPRRLVRRRAEEIARDFFHRMGIKEPAPEEMEKMIEDALPRAQRELKAGFILEAIIEKEGIKLDLEKEEVKLKQLAERFQRDPAKFKDQLGKEARERLREQWLEEEALDFLISEAKIKNKKVKPGEDKIDEAKP